MCKVVKLLVVPDFDLVCKNMGHDGNERLSEEILSAVISSQEKEGQIVEVNDSDEFIVPDNHVAKILTGGEEYYLYDEYSIEFMNGNRVDELCPGHYKFKADNHTFFSVQNSDTSVKIKVHTADNPDWEIHKIYKLITESAKKRFDYRSWQNDLGFIDTDALLQRAIKVLASGQMLRITALLMQNWCMMEGRFRETEYFVEFLEKRKKDLRLEIMAYKIAEDSIWQGSVPGCVYLQINQFLYGTKQ